MDWNGKPYHSYDYYLKTTFGQKIYKLSLNGGMTCPNRDGRIGTGGCIFCSEGGSGEFTPSPILSVSEQIQCAKEKVSRKITSGRYIAYFQPFSNTYAPVSYLEPLFSEAIFHPEIAGLSIATRPDCLPPDVLKLLGRLARIKPVWVELGLQTIHSKTAALIRRGYDLSCFEQAQQKLVKAGICVTAHVIFGLPGESREEMLDTVKYLGTLPIDGIKLQLLHVLRNTRLAKLYQEQPFPLMDLNQYADLVVEAIGWLPPEVIIQRISGDGPRELLIAPSWSSNKRLVLNTITRRFHERNIYQGCYAPKIQ